jgi:hypothetical protein
MQVIHGLSSRPIMIVTRFLIWEETLKVRNIHILKQSTTKSGEALTRMCDHGKPR